MTTKDYIEIYKKYPNPDSNSKYHIHYEGEKEDYQKLIDYNKELCKKYPWLVIRNRWTGDIPDDYDYSSTELDSMPEGWRIAFGDDLCEEIQSALETAQKLNPNGGYPENYITTNYDSNKILSYVDGFRITEIKEKFGEFRLYCNGAPREVYDIIDKYTTISRTTCIRCGKPAKWSTCGWISPYCDDCKNEFENKDDFYDKFELINEEEK